jgi:hypothetical protein
MAGSTPIYGFPYPEATDLVADYPALGQELAEDIEAALPTVGGLAPATPTSIANSGGSASLSGNTVTFTGVSSVSLNGCFTGSWNNYRLVMKVLASANNAFHFRLRNAGTDNSASNYVYQNMWGYNGNNVAGSGAVPNTLGRFGQIATTNCMVVADLASPAVAETKSAVSTGMRFQGSYGEIYTEGNYMSHTTTFDGITLLVTSGTITGTVSVYGYKS